MESPVNDKTFCPKCQAENQPPPQDIEAEVAVLGAVLVDNSALDGAVKFLQDERAFYRTSHGKIFRAMLDLRGRRVPVDLITLSDELKRRGALEDVGGSHYLTELSRQVASSASVEWHAKIVWKHAVKRKQIETLKRMAQNRRNGGDDEEYVGLLAELNEIGLDGREAPNDFELLADAIRAADSLAWLIDGWLAKGHVTLLAGAPKIGKSLLTLSACLALTHGGRFLGKQVGRARGLLLSGEDGAPILRERIAQMGIEAGDALVRFGGGEITQRFLREMRRALDGKGLRAIFVDPLLRFHSEDENSPDVARPVYLLRELAQEAGVAIWVTHHLRKTGGEYGADIRGSSALLGAADLGVIVKRYGQDGHRLKAEFLGRLCARPEPIVLSLGERLLWSVEGTLGDVQAKERDAAILELLNVEPMKAEKIAKALGIPRATVFRRLGKLKESELVDNRDGLWLSLSLTPIYR